MQLRCSVSKPEKGKDSDIGPPEEGNVSNSVYGWFCTSKIFGGLIYGNSLFH